MFLKKRFAGYRRSEIDLKLTHIFKYRMFQKKLYNPYCDYLQGDFKKLNEIKCAEMKCICIDK